MKYFIPILAIVALTSSVLSHPSGYGVHENADEELHDQGIHYVYTEDLGTGLTYHDYDHGSGGYGSSGHNSQGYKSQGHESQGHESQGHESQGYSNDEHGSAGHSSEGHSTEGHGSDSHSSEGHSYTGHVSEGHSEDEYSVSNNIITHSDAQSSHDTDGGDQHYTKNAGVSEDDGHYDHHVDYFHYPKYEVDYGVSDPHTGDYKKAWESRDGDVVRGGYTFTEADGSVRLVTYTSDHKSGFNAVVKHFGKKDQFPEHH